MSGMGLGLYASCECAVVCLGFGRGLALSFVLVRQSVTHLLLSRHRTCRCSNLVPAGSFVRRAISSACKGHIILPVLLPVPSHPAVRGGPPPGGCGLMMLVVRRGPGLCPVHDDSHSLCPYATEGLCCRLRF